MSSRVSISSLHTITTIAVIVVGLMFHELYKSTSIDFLGLISPVKTSYIFPLVAGIAAFIIITFGGIELYELFFGESHLPVHMLTFILGAIGGQFVRYRLMEYTKKKMMAL